MPPAQTGLSGCQSANGCFVASVATTVAGTRMIGNPFRFAVDPSDPTYEDLFTTAEASPPW
ncbi:hypothetical protein [uncultured Lamprocystis sp.]|uniref:hypothetical protein n=1 Tax=uncultured Lamprocystis sp. TaxID=543132 RepID=UPI0025F5D955|nr:hypothetical protein [uncultured Lamprocystis sp.]